MSNTIDNNNLDQSNERKSAVALRLEKARQAKAEKREKELAKEAGFAVKKEKTEVISRRKKSMKNNGPLSVPETALDPNFQYRFVEDKGWRMQEVRDLGYEVVTDSTGKFEESDMVIKSAKLGTVVGRPNTETNMILCRIPKEDYEIGKAYEREKNSRLHEKPQDKEIYEKQFDLDDTRK